MTVPKIRFKGFEGNWQKTSLQIAGTRRTQKNVEGPVSETFTNSAEFGVVSQLDFFDHSVSNSENIEGYYVVMPDDFIYNPRISQTAPYGPINRNKTGRMGVVSPLYSVFSIEKLDRSFAEWFFKGSSWHDFMRRNGDTGARHDRLSIGSEEFFDMELLVAPTSEEQSAIGRFINDFQRGYDLVEERVSKLRNVKKTLLVKMFPQSGSLVPEVRFEEFRGDWKPLPLGDHARFSKGTGYSKKDLAVTGTPIIHYGRLYTRYETEINSVDTFAPLRNGSVLSRGNEVLVPSSGESAEDIARASVLRKSGVILGGDLNIIRASKALDPRFLALTISHGSARDELVVKAQGNTIAHIKNDDLAELIIPTPSLPEQHAIGEHFRHLDKLIKLEEEYLKMLNNLKAALLNKMFV